MIYLLHRTYEGDPIGVWSSTGKSHYGKKDPALERSAKTLMDKRYPGQPWEDFADSLDDRVSHRDWWEIVESEEDDLLKVWYEVVPSDAPLFADNGD